jgi:protein MpaA
MNGRWTIGIPLGFMLAAAGCRPGPSEPLGPIPFHVITKAAPRPSRPAPPPPRRARLSPVSGRSVENRPLAGSEFGKGSETVLILGGIHGDEPAGTALSRRLCAHLASRPGGAAGRRVVVAPAANPDGLARGTRTNARGVDLNRNFSTRNFSSCDRHGHTPLSEPESRFIAALIEHYRPARIVTIHQPLRCVDYDGPGRELAEAMSAACGLPVRKLGARPGSLGSYAGVDRRIPIVTLELPAEASGLGGAALWQRYGPAMMAAIRFDGAAATASAK